jgi:hypothetical protein
VSECVCVCACACVRVCVCVCVCVLVAAVVVEPEPTVCMRGVCCHTLVARCGDCLGPWLAAVVMIIQWLVERCVCVCVWGGGGYNHCCLGRGHLLSPSCFQQQLELAISCRCHAVHSRDSFFPNRSVGVAALVQQLCCCGVVASLDRIVPNVVCVRATRDEQGVGGWTLKC